MEDKRSKGHPQRDLDLVSLPNRNKIYGNLPFLERRSTPISLFLTIVWISFFLAEICSHHLRKNLGVWDKLPNQLNRTYTLTLPPPTHTTLLFLLSPSSLSFIIQKHFGGLARYCCISFEKNRCLSLTFYTVLSWWRAKKMKNKGRPLLAVLATIYPTGLPVWLLKRFVIFALFSFPTSNFFHLHFFNKALYMLSAFTNSVLIFILSVYYICIFIFSFPPTFQPHNAHFQHILSISTNLNNITFPFLSSVVLQFSIP